MKEEEYNDNINYKDFENEEFMKILKKSYNYTKQDKI